MANSSLNRLHDFLLQITWTGQAAQQIINYMWLHENTSNCFIGVFRELEAGVRVPNTFWTLLLIAAAE